MHESSLEVQQLDSVVTFHDMKTSGGPPSTFHRETQEFPVNQEGSSQEKDIPLTHCCHYELGQNDNMTINYIQHIVHNKTTVKMYTSYIVRSFTAFWNTKNCKANKTSSPV